MKKCDVKMADSASSMDNMKLSDALEEMCGQDEEAYWKNAVVREACRRLRDNFRDYHALAESIGPETEMDERIKQFVGNLINEYNRMKRCLKEAEYKSEIDSHNFGFANKQRNLAFNEVEELKKKLEKANEKIVSLESAKNPAKEHTQLQEAQSGTSWLHRLFPTKAEQDAKV